MKKNAPKLLSIEDLYKKFSTQGGACQEVLKGVHLDLYSAEMIAIMGPSGEGKTTLLSLIAHLDSYDRGKILFPQYLQSTATINPDILRRDHVGMVFQSGHLLPDLTVKENLDLIYLLHGRKVPTQRVQSLLEDLKIADIAHKPVRLLSGGQKQRAGIARALLLDPQIILADEPTGNLDATTSEHVIATLRSFTSSGSTHSKGIIIVTHDTSVARACDRVLRLENGILTPITI